MAVQWMQGITAEGRRWLACENDGDRVILIYWQDGDSPKEYRAKAERAVSQMVTTLREMQALQRRLEELCAEAQAYSAVAGALDNEKPGDVQIVWLPADDEEEGS